MDFYILVLMLGIGSGGCEALRDYQIRQLVSCEIASALQFSVDWLAWRPPADANILRELGDRAIAM